MEKSERIIYYKQLKQKLSSFTDFDIENAIVSYYLSSQNIDFNENYHSINENVIQLLKDYSFPTDLQYIIELFELLLDSHSIEENGIVFTPKYIAEYIVKQTLEGITEWSSDYTILDPGCGCGIFLVTAAEYVHYHFGVSITDVINQNIIGFDINSANARRCRLVLNLLNARYTGYVKDIANVFCCDSLKVDWHTLTGKKSIDFIIGNPPYVNPHDLHKDTTQFLKDTFITTKSGVFNIFYAFIEQSMKFISMRGVLGFIVPNNFLSIKSAIELRKLLQTSNFLKRILDFGSNMIFKPVRTYNCIILLDKQNNSEFEYCVVDSSINLPDDLQHLRFSTMRVKDLDLNGWNLTDKKTLANLTRIESQGKQIKEFIKTGIATLNDAVYMVSQDDQGFFKTVNGNRYDIESDLIVPLYKISDLKYDIPSNLTKRHIIFPYEKKAGKYVLINETDLQYKYPLTYKYLQSQKQKLDNRDKGKGVIGGWYAYGRTQGLNNYGAKLLFPTFANKPKFIYIQDEQALFVNGYAVFENDYIALKPLRKILNSSIMHYYVSHTSYSIEGGYYCYQKKYIERFSIPAFSKEELLFITNEPQEVVDAFLINRYDLEL